MKFSKKYKNLTVVSKFMQEEENLKELEGLAPYGGQTSSSCGGLVAFGHQMGALQAPIW